MMDVILLQDSMGVFAVPTQSLPSPDEPVVVGSGRLFTTLELDQMRDDLTKILLVLADNRVTAAERTLARQILTDTLAKLAP